MRSAELTCPLYTATLSGPQRERRLKATAGCCPPLRCYRTQGRMGARVMTSGMPGASRRAVLGGATYSVVKVWVRLSGAARPATRQNQRHIPGARPVRAMSVRPGVDYLLDKAEARARAEYSTWVRHHQHGWTGWAGYKGGTWLDGNGTNVLGLCVGWRVRWRLVPLGLVEGCG